MKQINTPLPGESTSLSPPHGLDWIWRAGPGHSLAQLLAS